MNLYLPVLKSFLDPDTYNKYATFLDSKHLRENQPQTFKILQALKHLQDKKPSNPLTVLDVRLAFASLYPADKEAEYSPLFDTLEGMRFNKESITEYLYGIRQRKLSLDLAKAALALHEGQGTAEEVLTRIQHFADVQEVSAHEDAFGEMDIVKLLEEEDLHPGLSWRLPSLNRALGPIRKGNFGFMFARPETGKTTFLASEVPYMATKAESTCIWFNNEQAHGDVVERCYMGLLGWTLLEVKSKKHEAKKRFEQLTGNRFKVISNPDFLTKSAIEKVCEEQKPSLIVFDQIDNIPGFSADRNDLELKAIYQWARELSKRYGPVIGVCQAGASGEFKKYLTMNDVDNSKTGKQGAADFILGIGKTNDPGLETLRYFCLSKNKLKGCMDPKMRHGRWEVRIKPEVARYEDING